MVVLAQRWAHAFMARRADVVVQVSGGGTGVGIASLAAGTTDVATASRPTTDRERTDLERRRGRRIVETPVALDAVAVYVHARNGVRSLSLEEIADVFRGRRRRWSELGGAARPIVLYSRENSSGTYAYFKERVLGGADFAPHTQMLPGTAAVIHAIAHDENGIGYGGIGYGAGIRAVPLRVGSGEAVVPSAEDAANGRYPLARSLFLTTAGPPEGLAADFVGFATSAEGQRLVLASGFFPLPSTPALASEDAESDLSGSGDPAAGAPPSSAPNEPAVANVSDAH